MEGRKDIEPDNNIYAMITNCSFDWGYTLLSTSPKMICDSFELFVLFRILFVFIENMYLLHTCRSSPFPSPQTIYMIQFMKLNATFKRWLQQNLSVFFKVCLVLLVSHLNLCLIELSISSYSSITSELYVSRVTSTYKISLISKFYHRI